MARNRNYKVRWPWAAATVVCAASSALAFAHAGDVAGAWLWSIRLAVAAMTCGLFIVWPETPGIIRDKAAPFGRWLSVERPSVARQSVYPAFDWLRLVLACEVVTHHFLRWHWVAVQEVPTFLAVSGFLVLQSLRKDAKGFWASRALRILPALAAAISFDALVFGKAAAVKDIILATTLQFSVRGAVDYPLWSISVEIAAYAVMFVLWKWTRFYHRPRLILFTIAATWFLAPYIPIPQARLLTLAFVGSYVLLFCRNRAPAWLLPASVACMLLSVFEPATAQLTLPAALYGSAWALVDLSTRIKVPRLPWDISYGIYVFHIPILAALSGHSIPVRFAAVGMVAVLSWLMVERPALSLKRRLKSRIGDTSERGLNERRLQALGDVSGA